MRSRLLSAAVVLLSIPLVGFAAPAPAGGKAGGPPVVFQLAPVEKLLADVKTIVKAVAGDGLAGLVDGQIKAKLGEKGWAGLDTKKPIFGYVYLPNKALKGPDDFKEIYGFLAIPSTGVEDLKEFVNRLAAPADDPLVVKPVEGNKGLYVVTTQKQGDEPNLAARARFHDGYVYLGVNAKDELLDPKALLAAGDVVKANDPGLVLVRMFADRFPEEVVKQQAEQVEQVNDLARNMPVWGELLGDIATSYAAMSKRMAAQWKETDESGFRLLLDEKAGEVAFESYAVPKKGTAYAKELADTKPTTNRFASLVTEKTAAGALFQLPVTAPEMQDIFVKLIEQGQKSKDQAPPFAQPVLDELLKGLGRTVKAGGSDLAVAVNGPDKDGHYTALVALTFEDATGLEKAIKAAAKADGAPQEFKDALKFDVETIDGVNVHKLTPPAGGGGEPFSGLFGTKEPLVAFGPKGIYLALGTDASAALKSALTAKPAAANVVDVVVNPKKLGELVTAVNPQAGQMAAQVLGTDDKKVSAFYVSYEGGAMLKARVGVNLKIIPKALGFVFESRGGAAPPGN
jgi:hypothetical protein